jgi:tRNA A37 threonylcarbamoyladenosine biosynthesis protein TsaE
VLTLAHVEGITNNGIEMILKHCSSLHYLDIYGMKNITGSSFICIQRYAHELNVLVIEDWCDELKEMQLKELLEFNSKLRIHRTHTWKAGETYTCRLLQ